MQQKTIYTLSLILFIVTLVWGGITALSYLGMPVHESMLLKDGPSASTSCEGLRGDPSTLPGVSYLVCRGTQDFFPFIGNAIARMQPFWVYIALSVLLFAAFVGWRYLETDEARVQVRLRPWHFFAGFIASLWLLFTVIAASDNEGSPFVRLADPSPSVYAGLTEDTLQTLKDNFDVLQSRGCLKAVGQNDAGVTLYDMKGFCVQKSFFTRVMPQVLVALALLFETLVLGGALLRLFKFQPQRLLTEAMLSMGLGITVWIAILWLLAVLHLYSTAIAWAALIAVPALCFRSVLYWGRKTLSHSWDIDVPWYSSAVVCTWLLISLLALNFLTVIRPFPIGWDDLGSYLNRPRLLVSYGHIIHSMSTFQWEYLTSMGFRLFGYNSFFGATAAMIINWTQGLLAVLTLYLFGSTYLGRNRGLLAPVLYYFMPLVGHFSFADMKIDNSMFTMAALAIFAVFMYLFPRDGDDTEERVVDYRGAWQWLVLAGVFASLAFSIKVTSVMALMMILAVMLGASLHWSAFLGMVFLAFAAFVQRQVLDVTRLVQRAFATDVSVSPTVFLVILTLIGLGLLGYALWRTPRAQWKSIGLSFAIFIGAFAATSLPWLAYNNVRAGNVIPRLEMSFPNTLTPSIRLQAGTVRPGQELRTLPKELAIDPKHPACASTGSVEELDRYWGFDKGLSHYLTLPWRTVMNLDSVGYYVTTSFIFLLFPLLLLLPYFWTPKGKWLRYLCGGTFFILLEWMFLANGIPWYGLVVAAGLTIGLEALVAFAPDLPNRIVSSFFISLAILGMFSMRIWQYDQQKNLFEYPMGKISAEALQERTIPWYDRIEEVVTERHTSLPETPYLYRVGTFIPYFIPKNLEVIGMTDHQLDFFNCMNQERNPELTLKRLKALGFNSIIFDTNTATIENDPEGSLHKKVNAFVDFLNTSSLGLQVLVNDPQAGVAFVLLP